MCRFAEGKAPHIVTLYIRFRITLANNQLLFLVSKHHFLKIGATFRLLGGRSEPRFQYNNPNWEGDEGIRRFVLEEGSSLYQKLCNPTSSGECQYANTVTLDANIPCYGKECRIYTLIVVQVGPGTFYEYIRKACVQLSFYNGAKKVFTGVGPYLPELDTRQ